MIFRGYRLYRLDNRSGTLRPLVMSRHVDVETEAACNSQKHNSPYVPGSGCTCGLYSTKHLDPLITMMVHSLSTSDMVEIYAWTGRSVVAAEVVNWGRIIEHEEGYRSQFQRIESFLYWAGPALFNEKAIQYMAQNMNLPVRKVEYPYGR